MASFRRSDYRQLFLLGQELYLGRLTPKAAGTRLMAMSEAVIGQQAPWPCIHKRHRQLTHYELGSELLPDPTALPTSAILEFKR